MATMNEKLDTLKALAEEYSRRLIDDEIIANWESLDAYYDAFEAMSQEIGYMATNKFVNEIYTAMGGV